MGLSTAFNESNPAAALFAAVDANDYAGVALLVEGGIGVDARDGEGKTPLMRAVDSESLYMAGTLLGLGADVNALDRQGSPALSVIKNKPVTELLLQFGADPLLVQDTDIREFLIHRAIHAEAVPVVAALLASGIGANALDMSGRPLLLQAAETGNPEMVGLLLTHGAKVNTFGVSAKTPLRGAMESKSLACVELLLSADADPHAVSANKNKATVTEITFAKEEATPEIASAVLKAAERFYVFTAVEYQQTERLRGLLEAGMQVDIVDRHGKTPLLHAAEDDYTEGMKLLLVHKANANAVGPNGYTPLHHALEKRNLAAAKALTAANAGVYVANVFNVTPFDIAKQSGDKALINVVRSRRSDETTKLDKQTSALKTVRFKNPGQGA